MAGIPSITLSNGYKMPMLGLGTYLSKEGDVERAVKDAIDLGYRLIDTAYFYGNEKEIGKAVREKIQEGVVKREDLFITTKLWNDAHKEEDVVPTCKKSLENLGVGYIDLYLIHWPFALKECMYPFPQDIKPETLFTDTDYLETWRGMEECVHQGLTRSIGVSNFNSEQITRLMNAAKIVPVNNQVEVSVNLNQEKLIEFCKKYNITVTGYSPLGHPGNRQGIPNFLENSTLMDIAKKYGKTPAQIAIRYVYQQGACPIPKTVSKNRLQENMNIFDFAITPEDMKIINSIGAGARIAGLVSLKNHKYYPFSIPY